MPDISCAIILDRENAKIICSARVGEGVARKQLLGSSMTGGKVDDYFSECFLLHDRSLPSNRTMVTKPKKGHEN